MQASLPRVDVNGNRSSHVYQGVEDEKRTCEEGGCLIISSILLCTVDNLKNGRYGNSYPTVGVPHGSRQARCYLEQVIIAGSQLTM